MTAGRPSPYQPGYGREIINLMATGLSLTAAAADLGFHRDTIYEWEKKHPEFSDDIKLARAKRVLFLERDLLASDVGPRVTARIFALKNADALEWRDKQEVETSGSLTINVVQRAEASRSVAQIEAEHPQAHERLDNR